MDGRLSIVGQFGESVLQLALSGESSFAHLTLKVGQRLYTLDIRPTHGLDMSEEIAKMEAQARADDQKTRELEHRFRHLGPDAGAF